MSLLVVGVLAACAPSREPAPPELTATTGTVKVVRGRRWIVPHAPVADFDAAAAPEPSGVMAAFIDRDADDALDPDSEASTPCTVDAGRWQCAVEPRQITVLREEVEGGTALFVVPRWDAAASVRYCVGTDAGCDAPFAEMPSRPSEVKSGCADARTIWLETSPVRRITLDARPPLALEASLGSTAGGDLEVRIAGDVPERVYAWMGRPEAPVWDSETSEAGWRTDAGTLAISIPAAVVAACPGCGVELAVADHRRRRDDATGALVLDVRERRVHLAARAR